jgi:hypothetical protein
MKYFTPNVKLLASFGLLVILGCSKQMPFKKSSASLDSDTQPLTFSTKKSGGGTNTTQYTNYIITQGQHYCDPRLLKSVKLSAMKFMARFDSSAIYQTIDPVNQYDINKLYGFSEGIDHQYNSARIGWAWVDNALRLYAYAYNKGVRESQEICPASIGTDITCSISLSGSTYVFNVNGKTVTLSRGPSTSTASGYQLYPYFGGDEVAPHDILIKIKNL